MDSLSDVVSTSTLIYHIHVNSNVNIKHSDAIQWSIGDHFPVYSPIETDNNHKSKTNNEILENRKRQRKTAWLDNS